MAMFDIRCPRCGAKVVSSNLSGGKCNLSCNKCKTRFDIKTTSDSSKTGRYTVTNVRSM